MAKEPAAHETEGLRHAVRGLTDAEIRLNCLDLAVRAEKYMRGRVNSDPIDIAKEFYSYVQTGEKPTYHRLAMGGAPAPIVEGYGHGSPPRDDDGAGDDLTSAAASGTNASLRQAGGKS
jgi:hypothetical protein